jgi:hypothetical protein
LSWFSSVAKASTAPGLVFRTSELGPVRLRRHMRNEGAISG